jgi:hypothetical protein
VGAFEPVDLRLHLNAELFQLVVAERLLASGKSSFSSSLT